MIKLYKRIDSRLHYWECWKNDDTSSVVHWGKVGEKGLDKNINNEVLEDEIKLHLRQGYIEFDALEVSALIIEYIIDGKGDTADLEKRQKLEGRLNETLGWTGLGHCDGGSIGSNTMEVCCMIVDFDIAKNVIEADLTNSAFRDYNRIYLE